MRSLLLSRCRLWHTPVRSVFTVNKIEKPAVVVGVIKGKDTDTFDLTECAANLNKSLDNKLVDKISESGPVLKAGSSRLLGTIDGEYGPVIAVGLGEVGKGVDAEEGLDLDREAVRKAAASGVKAASALEVGEVILDAMGDSEAAAEGSTLVTWRYDELKSKKQPAVPLASPLSPSSGSEWARGQVLGEAQNLARSLMEAPANYLNPSQFCARVSQEMEGLPVEVKVRDKAWAEEMKMGSFLSVAAGSHQPPKFLELHFSNGGDSEAVVLVGKGVTFDTGGISIKPSGKMDKMRADMGGAAVVTATMKAVARLGLPVNLVVLVPLTENMPGGSATKPGDVVTAMNGKTIQVDNTDAEGRLILADALCYADTFSPRVVLDVATLTGAMSVALGAGATGVFSSSSQEYLRLESCGVSSGDRVWRMPLWSHYEEKMKKSPLADLNNISLTPGGGSCTAAAFLKQFTTCPSWLHLDIAGVMESDGEPYLPSGMSGRPTRTLVKYIEELSNRDA